MWRHIILLYQWFLAAQNSFHLPSYRDVLIQTIKQNKTFNVLEKNVKEKAVHYHQLMSHYFHFGTVTWPV